MIEHSDAPELTIQEAIPAYSEEGTLRLFRRLRGPIEGIRNHDPESLRDYLVLAHTPLVEHCARGFSGTGEPLEDLVQEGYVGLIKAVDRFDPEKGLQFSTYACHLIQGEIRHYLRDLGKLIHEPGWHSELRGRVGRTGEQLAQNLGRGATPEEIAAALEMPVETVRDVQRKAAMLTVESLDAPQEGEDGSERTRAERISGDAEFGGESRPAEAMVDDQLLFDRAMPQLRPLEKRAVQAFFWEEKSKTEIARELGISINYAAYLVKKGVESLREATEEAEIGKTETGAGQGSTFSASSARAAYLLTLTRENAGEAAQDAKERRAKPKVVPVPIMRSRVTEFAEWSRSLDDEVTRGQRYGEDFGVLWLRIANWDVLSGREEDENRRALESLKAVLRRACRGVDRVGVLPSHSLPGLNLLALMPHCGPPGEKLGVRWQNICREALSEGRLIPKTQIAFALFPGDGRSAEELLSFLSGRIFG